MIHFAAFALAATASAAAIVPPSASVADVVVAASLCVESVAPTRADASVLTKAGWTEHLLNGQRTPGGMTFEKPGVNVRIALVGAACSIVAAVESPTEVQAVLLGLDEALKPDSIAETDQGIRLTKGRRLVDFLVGPPSTRTPAAVRIDIRHSESR